MELNKSSVAVLLIWLVTIPVGVITYSLTSIETLKLEKALQKLEIKLYEVKYLTEETKKTLDVIQDNHYYEVVNMYDSLLYKNNMYLDLESKSLKPIENQ